jgi:hypothetical protein
MGWCLRRWLGTLGFELFIAELFYSRPVGRVRRAISVRVLMSADQKFQGELFEDRTGPTVDV